MFFDVATRRFFFMILSSLPNTFQKVRRVSPAQRGGLTARQSAARLQRAAVMASSQSEKKKKSWRMCSCDSSISSHFFCVDDTHPV